MQGPTGTNYATVDQSYFDKRGLNSFRWRPRNLLIQNGICHAAFWPVFYPATLSLHDFMAKPVDCLRRFVSIGWIRGASTRWFQCYLWRRHSKAIGNYSGTGFGCQLSHHHLCLG